MDDVFPMRMSYWYERLKDYTMPSAGYELSDSMAGELFELHMLSYEENVFELAEKYLERHGELRRWLEKHIGMWGGVFIRGDLASPKDACLDFSYSMGNMFRYGLTYLAGTQRNACVSWRPETALALIIASERVMSIGDPGVLWVRMPVNLSNEYRVFVRDGEPRLISWYYPGEPVDGDRAETILHRMEDLRKIIGGVAEKMGSDTFSLDIGFLHGKILVVEYTLFPSREKPYLVDPIMFRRDFWSKLREAEEDGKVVLRYPSYSVEEREVVLNRF